jgi:ribose transport system permease protein
MIQRAGAAKRRAGSVFHSRVAGARQFTPASRDLAIGEGIKGGAVMRDRVARAAPWGTILALLLLIVVFGALKPHAFLSWDNLRTILLQSAGLGIVAAGLTLVLILGEFDLSVAAMATLGGVTAALLAEQGVPILLAFLLTIVLGVIVGTVNGLVTARLNVNSFIATLATTAIVTGLGTWWANSQAIGITDSLFLKLSTDRVAGIPLPAIIAIVVYALLWVVLERTRVGRMIYAAGANSEGARLAGIRVDAVRVGAFAGCSAFAAIAGILLASQLSSAYQGAGEPYLLPAFAAAFLGATQLKHGRFNAWGTIIAVLLLGTGTTGLALANAPQWAANMFVGVVLIASLAVTGIQRRATAGPGRFSWARLRRSTAT